MFNMDGTSHMATQRHESTVAQKIKQLAVTAFSECEQNMAGDKRTKSTRMFNMDGTSHMATQRHETTVAQKIKQLGVTASSECEQNTAGDKRT